MEKINEKVATVNAQNNSIYKMFILSKSVDDEFESSTELTGTPNKRANQIKDMWLVNMALNGFDTTNPEVEIADSTMVVTIPNWVLCIYWDELTDDEYDLIKGHIA